MPEKRVQEQEMSHEEGRPKRQRVAPKRYVEEFHEEIAPVLNSADEEEGEDLGSDLEGDFADWAEDHAEEILRYATEQGIDIDQAAFRLYGADDDSERSEEESYDSSFINDADELSELSVSEEEESEESDSAGTPTETTDSDDKENCENFTS